jgi:hypothetical protein
VFVLGEHLFSAICCFSFGCSIAVLQRVINLDHIIMQSKSNSNKSSTEQQCIE